MRQIVLISGRTCNGKSDLAKRLELDFGYRRIHTAAVLRALAGRRGSRLTSSELQKFGDDVDQKTQYRWVVDAVEKECKKRAKSGGGRISVGIVVDNIRNARQLECFRQKKFWSIVHVHLYAPHADLRSRYKKRMSNVGGRFTSFAKVDLIKNERDIASFKRDADVRINTGRTDGEDTLVRVAARLGLYSPPTVRCVDVLVGGQYGSEGKGHIAAYLAREYDVLVRVGGPNAGHTVSSASSVYTYHQLPSGARDTKAKLLLGPGMTIRVPDLLKEIRECQITPGRLFIDPQAMIIEDEDIEQEKCLVREIGSTGRGGGAAASRRILGRQRGSVRLARDIEELAPYVGTAPRFRGSTREQLEIAYRRESSILVEGTQGSGLSLYHGDYPFVTSRDTNVAGCLAEVGISPSRVRRILMVVRTTPIRVASPAGGCSGPLKHEVTFERISSEASLNSKKVRKREITSTTGRDRRVGWFEWELFRRACALNAPTDVVLTFADYIDSRNQKARRFEQLTEDTIKFVEELERVAQAPVSLINTRFPRTESERMDLRTVIDRRNWRQSATG